MQLQFNPLRQADAADLFDVAGARSERQAIEGLGDSLVLRQPLVEGTGSAALIGNAGKKRRKDDRECPVLHGRCTSTNESLRSGLPPDAGSIHETPNSREGQIVTTGT